MNRTDRVAWLLFLVMLALATLGLLLATSVAIL
jgi:hypothetical protein